MVLDLIFNIIIAIGVIIGFFGGIPKIREMLKPKPSFKVTKNLLAIYKNENHEDLFIRIKNNGKAIATSVSYRWAIIRKETDVIVDDSDIIRGVIGLLAPDTSKQNFAICQNLDSPIDPSKEYDLWIRVECDEGYYTEKRLTLTIEETDKSAADFRELIFKSKCENSKEVNQ